MNEVMKLLKERMSLREYDPMPIAEEDMKYIIESTLRAPTSGNLMMYSIIRVNQEGNKKKLSKLCDDQPFIAQAPGLFLFVSDLQRLQDYFVYAGVGDYLKQKEEPFRTPGVGALMLGISDALIAAQNMVIAGESLGIGSCYIGDIMENYEEIRDMFLLPKYTFPVAMLAMGYYPENFERRVTERYGQKFIFHEDVYQRMDAPALEEMFREKETWFSQSGIEDATNFAQLIYTRKFGTEVAKEMDRSVSKILENWQRA